MFALASFSQTNQHFVQGMLSTQMEDQQIRELDNFIRTQPQIEVCRIDLVTKRIFILSKNGQQVSESFLRSLFVSKQADFTCYHTGVYGIDEMRKYPFENCDQWEIV